MAVTAEGSVEGGVEAPGEALSTFPTRVKIVIKLIRLVKKAIEFTKSRLH